MRNKSGATEWTIGKLLSLILLVIFLVLVIWGYTTGGLNPLIQKAEGKFDEVLILFHLKDGGNTNLKCVTYQNMKIDGIDQVGDFTQCLNECNITYKNPIGNFKINAFKIASSGNMFVGGCYFEILSGGKLYCEDKYIINIKEAEEAKAAYLALKILLGDLEKEYGSSTEIKITALSDFEKWLADVNGDIKIFTGKEYWYFGGTDKFAEPYDYSSALDFEKTKNEIYSYYESGKPTKWEAVSEVNDNYFEIVTNKKIINNVVIQPDKTENNFTAVMKFDQRNIEFDKGSKKYFFDGKKWTYNGNVIEEKNLETEMYGSGLVWGRKGDEKRYLPGSYKIVTETVPVGERANESTLEKWFDEKINEGKDLEFDVYIYNSKTIFYYKNGKWSCPTFSKETNDILKTEGIFEDINRSYTQKGFVLWNYIGDEQKHLVVSDIPIATEAEKAKVGTEEFSHSFSPWLSTMTRNWKENFSNSVYMEERLNDIFENGEVKVRMNGKEYKLMPIPVRIFGKDMKSLPVITFMKGDYQYGIFYDSVVGDYRLAGYGTKNNAEGKTFGVSPYDNFMRFSDSEWEDVKLINLINNFFHTKC